MLFELKKSCNPAAVFITLSVLTLLVGWCCGILSQLGLFLIPVVVCIFFTFVAFCNDKYRPLAFSFLIVSSIVEILISGFQTFSCLCSVFIALILYLFARNRVAKSHAVAYSVIITFLLSVVYLYLLAAASVNSFDFNDVAKYYVDLINSTRDSLWSTASQMTVNDGTGTEIQRYSQTDFNTLYDSFILLTPGIISLACFLLIGLSCKLVRLSVSLLGGENKNFSEWRFESSRFFSYFYVALAILYALSYGTDIITVTLDNLYLLFMIVYAYIGVGPVIAFLSRRNGNKLMAAILLIAAFLLFGYTAISLLSLIGVFSNLNSVNNASGSDNNTGGDTKG